MGSVIDRLSGEPSVDLTPMIDVTFQLITFFMVVSTFEEMQREADLMLPVASQCYVQEGLERRAFIVNVERHGVIKVCGRVCTPEELKVMLDRHRAALGTPGSREDQPPAAVIVRGDVSCRFDSIKTVLAAAQKARIEGLHFAAFPPPEGREITPQQASSDVRRDQR